MDVEKRDKTSLDEISFEEIERGVQQVMDELSTDECFERFRSEYEKLFSALKKSHEGENRLLKKCLDLNAEIVANTSKVSAALKMSEADQDMIKLLKKEIEAATKRIEESQTREAEQNKSIDSYQEEIRNLTKFIQQNSGANIEQNRIAKELAQKEMELTVQRDDLQKEVEYLKNSLAEAEQREQDLEVELDELNGKIHEFEQDIQTRINDNQREVRRKDKLERELKQMQADIQTKTQENQNLEQKIEQFVKDKNALEKDKYDLKQTLDKQQKDKDALEARFQKLQSDYETQMATCESLSSENQSKVTELKQKESEISSLKVEIQKMTKLRDAASKKLRTMEEQKMNLEHSKEALKLQISAIEKELDMSKRAGDHERKEREDLIRERDSLNQNVHKAISNTKMQSDMVKVLEKTKINLEQEIHAYREEAGRLRKMVAQLEKERDKVISDSSAASAQILQCMDDLKVKEAELYDMKKTMCALDIKYKQQEQLFEAARLDRNAYSRSLVEKQDEIVELKKKLKTINHQVEHLKDEISSKNEALQKEHSDFMKIERDREKLKGDIDALKKEVAEKESSVASLQDKEIKMTAELANVEEEKNQEKKKLDAIIREKNLIGTQLVQRNDELSLLYEKIDLQERTLDRGELQYAQRQEDIRVLKLEITKLRTEKELLQKRVANMNEMSNEVYRLEKELLREKTKCRALEDELENPINVHRWRKLEASDPSTYEMIEKIQMLQKRLIKKTEEAVEKELLSQEKEKMLEEMKKVLARQFNPELQEQIRSMQAALKEKNKQLKLITSEMVMHQHLNREYRTEIDNLKDKMKDIKRRYLVIKKKDLIKDPEKLSLPPLFYHLPNERKNYEVTVLQENLAI